MAHMNNLLYAMILSILLLFSLILYYFPKLIVFFFSSHLGNIMLIVAVLLLGFYNYRLAIGVGSIFVILFQAYRLSNTSSKEGFSWSSDLVDQFVKYQKTFNPDSVFDMSIVQKQASPEDVQYLFDNNKWPWSSDIQEMYKDYIAKNNSISIDPDAALTMAQSVYNETAIKELMSWNTKEGTFLLSGVTIGHTEGLPDNMNNIVRCGVDSSKSDSESGNVMEKIVNVGYASINGNMIQNKEIVDNNDLPSIVPGFKFLAEPCNPCGPMNDTADYSCPFSLDVGDGAEVSPIWNYLWGVKEEKTKTSSFPLLNELKKELNNVSDLYNPVITSDKGIVGVQTVLDKSNNTKESSDLNSNM